MRAKKFHVLIIASVAALALGLWLGQLVSGMVSRPPPPEVAGIFFPEPKEIKPFTLTDQTGAPFQRERFQGKWTFIYFGYTYCPDICPMTLAELNQMQNQLAEQGLDEDNAYLLISVDPQRDTPQRLGEYTAYFNDKFKAATGTPEELDKLAQQFGVVYMRSPGQEGKADYTVDHSSTVILVDPDAKLHAIFTPPHKPETMAADFAKIYDYYEAFN